VVLVAVGDEDRVHGFPPLLDPGAVRRHRLHAQAFRREEEAAVDDQDAPVALEGEAVHADLAEPAQGEDADRRGHGGPLSPEPPAR